MKKLIPVFLLLLCCTAQAQQKSDWVVAADGSGRFRTVQAAIDAVPAGNQRQQTIFIKKGRYREVIVADSAKRHIRLLGEGPDSTLIVFDHHSGQRSANGDTINTWTSATVFVSGSDFSAENIGFRNDAGFAAGQAVALRVEGDRAAFRNCRITGFQDVLFLSGAGKRSYFRDCYIEGTTDFIFGAGTAVFRNCTLHSKKNSHITAASTDSAAAYGFVFFDCRLTADTNVHKVSLGRPWRPYSSVTYIRCWMDDHILPEGWNNRKNPANERTARYAEYRSSGPGASSAGRVPWARQLTAKEARRLKVQRILGGWRGA